MTAQTISVAMCTYNGQRFLQAQLESILQQSRPPAELIICDDRSIDSGGEIVREVAQNARFPVRFFVNDKNLKSTKNFENAIGLCRGSIVALADQDDVWYEHKLDRIEKAFQSQSVVAAFSDADLIDENSQPLGRRLWPTLSFDLAKQKAFAAGKALGVLVKHPVVTGATMAFRREVFECMAPIPANEVHDQWMSFLLAAKGRIEIIPEPLIQYRRHAGQQLGPGPTSLKSRMAEARARGESFYVHEIDRFRQLHEHLEIHGDEFPGANYAQRAIRQKVAHLEHRARLSTARADRIPKVLREALNGNYWRYSGGWVSIAKDMIIR